VAKLPIVKYSRPCVTRLIALNSTPNRTSDNKKSTRVADRAFSHAESLGRNRVILVVSSRESRMGKRDRYRDHVDPEYRRWGRTYHSFPGVDECAGLILDRRATGAWADIIAYELAENASEHLNEFINAFRLHESDDVALYVLMALELAALPASVDFLSSVLREGNPTFKPYAQRALRAIDTKESRTALFTAMDAEQ
jgi:hypothetical protein